jgi:hypothetical protein
MVKIAFGNGITAMRGSAGGNTFSLGPYGPYMKAKATPTNPRTQRQIETRGVFADLAREYTQLPPGLKTAWKNWASQHPFTNELGQAQVYSAINAYIKVNGVLINMLEDGRDTPPPERVVPAWLYTNSVANAGASTLTVNVGTDPFPANTKLYVYSTFPHSPGVSYVKGLFRYVGCDVPELGAVTFPFPDNFPTYATDDTLTVWIRAVDDQSGLLDEGVQETIVAV